MILNVENTAYPSFSALVRDRIKDKNQKAHVITFGCQQNEADSERLYGMAEEMGYQKTDEPSKADMILVNTCAVREHAELKALSITGGFKKYKENNPDVILDILRKKGRHA